MKLTTNKEAFNAIVEKFNNIESFSEKFVKSFEKETPDGYSNLSCCLIKIEPIKLNSSTKIFGSKFKSSVSNKLTLCQAIISKEDPSKFVAGDILFETLISDEALSLCMFNSNAKEYPCTFINVLGDQLSSPENDPNLIINPIDIVFDNEALKNFSKSKFEKYSKSQNLSDLDVFCSKLLTGSVSKKELSEAQFILQNLTTNTPANFAHIVDSFSSSLDKDMVSFKVELSSMLEKINKFYSSSDTLLLEKNINNEKFNYLRWLLNGGYTTNERLSLAKVIIEMTSDFDDEHKKDYSYYLNSFSNELILEEQSLAFESNGSIGLKKTSSTGLNIFGSQNKETSVIEIDFHSACLTPFRDSHQLNPLSKIATVSMSFNNLLVLLRGNSTSEFIPCSVTDFGGKNVTFKKIHIDEKKETSEKVKANYVKEFLPVIEAHKHIENFLKGNVTTKAQRLELHTLIKEYISVYDSILSDFKSINDLELNKTVNSFKNELKNNFEKFNHIKSEFELIEKSKDNVNLLIDK